MDELTIQHRMWTLLLARGHKAVMPNVSWSWLHWEADLISVTKADYWHEYEIKCTKADFVRDFEKFKHRHIRSGILYTDRIPNYFWYVAPINAIPLCIPDYAGLILVTEDPDLIKTWPPINVECVKEAKRLHDQKLCIEGYTSMLRSVMFKYWDMVKINAEIRRNNDEKRNQDCKAGA